MTTPCKGNETIEKEQDLTHVGESDGVDDMEEDSIHPPSMRIESYKEALQALEDVQEFLYSRGHTKEAMQIGPSVDTLVSLKMASS